MKIRFIPSVMAPRPADVLAKHNGTIQGTVKGRGRKMRSIMCGFEVCYLIFISNLPKDKRPPGILEASFSDGVNLLYKVSESGR